MQTVHVLTDGFTSPNGASFLLPLIKFANEIRDLGIQLKIFETLNDQVNDCDILLLDGKYFKGRWHDNSQQTLSKINNLSENTNVIWCDQTDSSGTLSGQVLPYVKKYLKAQLLCDRREYMKEHYASRIYTDYYHKKFGINDKDYYSEPPIETESDLTKLGVSWNSAFMNYGAYGPYLLRLREKVPINALLGFTKPRKLAKSLRNIDVTCRMGISYPRETVCYQRKQIREILKSYVQTNKLSRSKYLKEMDNCKVTVSPFGFGEITLKDFECFISGSMLLKPDMSHMQTWPNLYIDKQTCLFHSWDLDDVQEKIDWALCHDAERIEISQNGQNNYAKHITDKGAGALFAAHMKEAIKL